MADGVIRIDTRLDNSNIPKDIEELKNMVANSNVGEEAKQSVDELANSWAKLETQQARNNQRMVELREKLDDLIMQSEVFANSGDTRLYEEVKQDIDATQLKLREAEQNAKNIDVAMGKISVNARSLRDSMSVTEKSSKGMDINYRSIGKNLLRYGLALFSVRSVYLGLTRAVQAWMRSTKEGAQAQADLAYVWQSIGSAVAPVFLYMINLMKIMLGYVNAITKAFFGFEIFSKKGANNINSMAKGAKETKKQLSGFDEMNVISDSSGSAGSSGVSAMGFETPDISGFTTWMERLSPVIESVKNGIMVLWQEYLQPMFASIGEFMVGVGESFITGLEMIFEWATNNGPVIEGLAMAVGILTVAFVAMKLVMLAISALAGLSPLGWIILAIMAIITAIGFWKNNQEAIQKFIDKSLKVIGDAFVFVFNWIMNVIKTSLDFVVGVFRWAFNLIMTIMRAPGEVIKWLSGVITKALGDAFSGAWGGIKKVFDNIIGIFKGIITFITGVFSGDWKKAWQGIISVFENIVKGLSNVFKLPFNFIIDGINSFIRSVNKIKIPSWVPVVGGNSFSIPTIPRLARGGVVTSATQAIIGEAGREAVVPLQNNTGWANDFLDVLQSRGGFGGGGSITIIQQLDGKEIARHTLELQKEAEFRTNGGLNYGY